MEKWEMLNIGGKDEEIAIGIFYLSIIYKLNSLLLIASRQTTERNNLAQ